MKPKNLKGDMKKMKVNGQQLAFALKRYGRKYKDSAAGIIANAIEYELMPNANISVAITGQKDQNSFFFENGKRNSKTFTDFFLTNAGSADLIRIVNALRKSYHIELFSPVESSIV